MTDQNETVETPSAGPVLPAKWYNIIKWFVLIFLPAFASFYFGAAGLLHWPYATEVVGFCALFATFLGVTLGISNRNFNKGGADGSINAVVRGDQVILSKLALPNIAPEELAAKKSITIKVNPENSAVG
jgi:hypothetical protein